MTVCSALLRRPGLHERALARLQVLNTHTHCVALYALQPRRTAPRWSWSWSWQHAHGVYVHMCMPGSDVCVCSRHRTAPLIGRCSVLCCAASLALATVSSNESVRVKSTRGMIHVLQKANHEICILRTVDGGMALVALPMVAASMPSQDGHILSMHRMVKRTSGTSRCADNMLPSSTSIFAYQPMT